MIPLILVVPEFLSGTGLPMKLIAITALAAVSTASFAGLITFDESGRFDGEVLSNQYSGVTFAAGNTTGATIAGTTTSLATNTTMVLTTSDVGGGLTAPISGRLLRSFGGWLSENGDPIFTITFAQPISDISIDFGGIFNAASTRMFAVTGTTVTASTVAPSGGTQTLTLSGLNTSTIVVTPGDFQDWVGVDNIRYTSAVPEPATLAVLGVGLLALRRRKTAK